MKHISLASHKHAEKPRFRIIGSIIVAVLVALTIYVFTLSMQHAAIAALVSFLLLFMYNIARLQLRSAERIRRMELVFPDFIELVASNLRAGLTIDRALLFSSRKEFAPLDSEILMLGKDIITGKEITTALRDLGERTHSEKIQKTINIITTGIVSGGNLAVLLEETAANMRERAFVEKRAASNVLMYVIFILFAIAIGTPVLFSLSSVLVEVMAKILATIPAIEVKTNLPFTLNKISISSTFILYFSLLFIVATDILASLILGLVSKGEEREGMRYMAPLIAVGVATFLAIRFFIGRYFTTFFG